MLLHKTFLSRRHGWFVFRFFGMAPLLTVGFVFLSLAEWATAAEPLHPGWGGISIEEDPAEWVLQHADIDLDGGCYELSHVSSCAKWLARVVDRTAGRNCGVNPEANIHPHHPSWTEIKKFDLDRLRTRAVGDLTRMGRQVDWDLYHPVQPAFPLMMADLINRRVQEIRWPQESSRSVFTDVLNGGIAVSGPIVLIGNYGCYYDHKTWDRIAAAIDRRGSNLPVIWLPNNNSDLRVFSRYLVEKVMVIRKALAPEHHTLENEGRLHFNTDRLLAIGAESFENDSDYGFIRFMLQSAIHDALSYSDRTQVDVEIPLDLWIHRPWELANAPLQDFTRINPPFLENLGYKGLLAHTIAGSIAFSKTVSRAPDEASEYAKYIDDEITHFALLLSAPWNYEKSALDGTEFLGDIEIRRPQPDNKLSLERLITFRRADDKRVNFRFTCPFDAAKLNELIKARAPFGYQ